MNIDSVLLHYLTSEKLRHYVLANLLCQIWVLLVIANWCKQAHCVIYFTNIDSVLLYYLTSEKADTTC